MKNRDVMVVKASAGTGKTYRLALEYISRLLLGEDYNEILFMTFTRAATSELKDRIFEFLNELTLQSSQGKEIEESIKSLYSEIVIDIEKIKVIKRNLLENKDKIRIYTIDSFIGQIFKKAIGPYLNIYSYTMANSLEAEEVYKEVFSRMINGHEFNEVKSFLEETADREVDKYISLIKIICEKRWKFSLIQPKIETLDAESIKDNLFKDIIEIFSTLRELGEEPKKEYIKTLGPSSKLIEQKFKGDLSDSKLVLEFILENKEKLAKDKYYNGTQTRAKNLIHYKEKLEELQERVWNFLKRITFIEEVLPYEKEILKMEKLTRRLYDDIKFREKKMTFSDLTNYTSEYINKKSLDLVKDKEVTDNFYEIIGGKITTLFLDEAQDTGVSQWKIVEPIAKSCKNIIIVGDEKQSIYSWRGGNKGLFLNFSKMLNGRESSLDTNYRSEKKIIDFINVFFESVSNNFESENSIGWNYKHVNCSKKEDKGYVSVMVDLDIAQEIAIDIKEKASLGETVNYRGIGVVARTKALLSEVGEKLKELKIPYIMNKNLSITKHEFAIEVMRLLKFFIHNDYMTLVEFFRNNLNVSEEDLKYLLQNRERINSYIINYKDESVVEKEEIKESIKVELDKIMKLRETEYKELGRGIIKEYSLSTKYSSPRDIKNIALFLELMENFTDVASFVKDLFDNEENYTQIGATELNSVNLMTIHGSKGLDFHTEYMILEDKKDRYKITEFDKGRTANKLLLLYKLDKNYENIEDYLFTNSEFKNSVKDLEVFKHNEQIYFDEVINNMYVGLTRPRANLTLCIKPTKTTVKKEDVVVLKNDLLIRPIERFFNTTKEELISGGSQIVGKYIPYKEKLEEIKINEFSIDPKLYSDLKEVEELEAKEETKEKEKFQDVEMTVEKELKRKSGLAIHYFMENIKYGTKEEIELAKKLTLNKYSNMLGVEKIQEIIKRVDEFIKSNQDIFHKRWEVFRELELVTLEEFQGKMKKRVHIIDRLNIDKVKKEIMIFDYKSGKTMDKEQLLRYKRVVESKIGTNYKIKIKFLELSLI